MHNIINRSVAAAMGGGPAIRHIFGRNVDIFMIDTSLLSLIRRGPRHILALPALLSKKEVSGKT